MGMIKRKPNELNILYEIFRNERMINCGYLHRIVGVTLWIKCDSFLCILKRPLWKLMSLWI